MEKSHVLSLVVYVLFLFPFINGELSVSNGGTKDGSEVWGYVQVRPKAHMFWWYYKSPYRTQDSRTPWPIILWLQGGPGLSGTGLGNFGEIGQLDTLLKPRNSTWLKKADLLFVDSPVGAGYSYVEDKSLLVKTDDDAVADLTKLLIIIFKQNMNLHNSPLYIMGESYGGKFAVSLGLSALKEIKNGRLKLKLGGVAMGGSWTSPLDSVTSYGPLLKDISRLDNTGLFKSNSIAKKIKQQLESGKFIEATNSWLDLKQVILDNSNGVSIFNFMLDTGMNDNPGANGDLNNLMNGEIMKKLKIIPKNVTWGGQIYLVFDALKGDFMKPRIDEVDHLLAEGVDVSIYIGQLDIVCSTMGTEAWVQKLKWNGLRTFMGMNRTPIYSGNDKMTKGFIKSYRNLKFYWILGAGHFVPFDQPCVALSMVDNITHN